MSSPSPSPAPAPTPSWPTEPPLRGRSRDHGTTVVGDVLWAVLPLLVVGALAGVLWNWWAVPPSYERVEGNAVMDQAQLALRVGADGRFAVIGLVVGLIAGLVLTRWRDTAPLRMVLIGVVAVTVAGYLALRLGTYLGRVPDSVGQGTPVGQTFPDSLQVISGWVLMVWPVGYLLASTAVLWVILPTED